MLKSRRGEEDLHSKMVGARSDAQPDPCLSNQLPALIVPLRFGVVAHSFSIPATDTPQSKAGGSSSSRNAAAPSQRQSIYRGALPRRRNLPFLTRLRPKTILSLTPKPLDALDPEMRAWAEGKGVKLVHIRCDKPKDDGGGLSREGAARALLVSFLFLVLSTTPSCTKRGAAGRFSSTRVTCLSTCTA